MKKILFVFFFIIIGCGAWMLNSEMFESEPPVIDAPDEIYWNYKDALTVKVSDNIGIQNYRVYINSQTEQRLIESTNPPAQAKVAEITINPPENTMFIQDEGTELRIIVTDTSKWGFGNSSTKNIKIIADTKKPDIEVISHSYKIVQGGSAFVVFKAVDKNISSISIVSGDTVFKPVYFADGGYYAALLGWESKNEQFSPYIKVEDKAGNVATQNIAFYIVKRKYKDSTITINDSFINGKISSLIEEINQRPLSTFETQESKFNYINNEIRSKNIEIVNLVGKNFNQMLVLPSNFKIKKFYPLKNGAAVGSYGDHRYFSYNGNIIGESYHLGIDFASIKQAPIIITNGGEIAFAEFNGIYGNTVILDHGLGLMSLYAHMTSIDVKKGDMLEAGTKIGNTGLSGLVLGDHLHFGVLVQGIEVNPAEWLDQKWINDNIYKVINDANNVLKTQ